VDDEAKTILDILDNSEQSRNDEVELSAIWTVCDEDVVFEVVSAISNALSSGGGKETVGALSAQSEALPQLDIQLQIAAVTVALSGNAGGEAQLDGTRAKRVPLVLLSLLEGSVQVFNKQQNYPHGLECEGVSVSFADLLLLPQVRNDDAFITNI
jgi:hypothetical protein